MIFNFQLQYIRTLGPLDYILNTPRHHRVHHGRNPYCIDKNYAGVLIIWDRLFGKSFNNYNFIKIVSNMILLFILSIIQIVRHTGPDYNLLGPQG